ncbi:lycopene cyclase family protein [Demequina silvatica]|uniref:lycopene cyclase family protein n=1 Tax=Demequina silvatica TaxID=1638988 RepID=UPI000783C529|nr:lycopene cyclase family protein [Demequina silvatica]
MTDTFDAVILGGGAAGLTLAARLAGSRWRGTLLMVDDGAHALADRCWAWWSTGGGPLDAAATTTLAHANVAGPGWQRRLDLAPYAYRAITGEALGGLAFDAMERRGWTRETATARSLTRDDAGVAVTLEGPSGAGRVVRARWVFDSVGPGAARTHLAEGPHLDFLGVGVDCDEDVFDPDAVTFMDLRTDQEDGLAFMYVLPTSARSALVERVRFVVPGAEPDPVEKEREADETLLRPTQPHAHQLTSYLREVLRVGDHRIVHREHGLIPLLTQPPAHPAGGVIPIGARAGMVKASTGYGIARMDRHAAAIAAALARGADPGRAAPHRRGARALDAALLRVIRDDPRGAADILAGLLTRHPPARVLAFLDEQASAGDQARIIASLPEFARSRARSWFAPVARW